MRIIEKPTKTSAGKATHYGKIYHNIKGKGWIYCGDCNEKGKNWWKKYK